jgi:H+/Cl- antiporter ClcA
MSERDAAGSPTSTEPAGAVAPVTDTPRFFTHVIVAAFLSGLFALVWYVVYLALNEIVWENEFVASNWWVVPLIILAFSLAVGLAVKYLHAPTSMDGTLLDELTGDPTNIRWKLLPVTVLQSLISLLSGAVVGPEGALGRFAGQIAEWYSERFKIPAAMRERLVFAAAASAYNGLLQNPLFTAVLGADIARGSTGVWTAIPSNLLGGAVGFAVFQLIGGTGIANYLDLGAIPTVAPVDLLWAIAFAIVGMIVAIFGAISMQVAARVLGRLEERPVARAMIAGVILSIVGLAAPVLLFSGEDEVGGIVADPGAYGFWVLLAMAVVKLVLLAISFKSGFMGGPTFPVIFAATCVALAINVIIPEHPFVFIEAGVLGGALMALFRTPLMVVLLTSFFLGANTELVTLVVISVVTVVALLPIVEGRAKAAQASRQRRATA